MPSAGFPHADCKLYKIRFIPTPLPYSTDSITLGNQPRTEQCTQPKIRHHDTQHTIGHQLGAGPQQRRAHNRTDRRFHVRPHLKRRLADRIKTAQPAGTGRTLRREPVHHHRRDRRARRLRHRRRPARRRHAHRQQHVVADAAGRAGLGGLRIVRVLQGEQRHHSDDKPTRIRPVENPSRHRRARPAAVPP